MPGEVVHLALGGTISMRVLDGLAQPTLKAAELAQAAGIKTVAVDLATLGGPQLDFELLTRVAAEIDEARAREAAGVIVTLGTDAIEEVGAFLAYCGPWGLNVVLTGSMAPGGEPNSDGPTNLRDAAAIAASAALSEPVVVFAGRVELARAVMKVRALDLDAFDSPTEQAWSVEQIVTAGHLPDLINPPTTLGRPGPHTEEVPIILSALATGPHPQQPPLEHPPALVFVASGAGNLTPNAAAHAQAALQDGSVVAISTRALDRKLSAGYGYPGGSGQLVRAGAVLAAGMSPHRLRVFLLIALSQGLRGDALKQRLGAHIDSLLSGMPHPVPRDRPPEPHPARG